jgi:predicted dehydrogenase
MLDIEKPDAVCLVVPEPITARLAKPLLEKGIPLLLEKPPGISIREVLELEAVAKKYQTPHLVAFNRRHMPLVKALKSLIKKEGLQLLQIRYEMIRVNRTEAHFYMTAIHGLDLVRYLVDAELKSFSFSSDAPLTSDPSARIYEGSAHFSSGVRAQWLFSPMAGSIFERLSVHALGHSIYLHLPVWGCLDTPGFLEHFQKGALVSKVSGDEVSESPEPFVANGFFDELKTFLDGVRSKVKLTDDLTSSVDSLRLAEALHNATS